MGRMAGPAMAGLKVQNVLSVALFSIHRGFFVKKHTKKCITKMDPKYQTWHRSPDG